MRTRFTALQRSWAPEGGSSAGAGGSESGGAPAGGKREDGEKTYTKAEVDELVRKSVSEAIGARFGKEKSQSERKQRQAADDAVQAFRDEHGLDDDALERLQSQQSELTVLKREHSKLQREHEERSKALDASESWRRNRLVDDALDQAFDGFREKHGHRVIDSARADMRLVLRNQLRVEDDGTVVPLKDGQPLHGKPVGDWVADQLQGRKHVLEPTTTGGAGSRPGGSPERGKSPPDLGTDEGVGALWGDEVAATKK